MSSDLDASREAPAAWRCGSYTPGHDVHYIQARLSFENGPGELRIILDVAEDGTITFSDGRSVWTHDPERLRAVLDRCGPEVRLGTHGVLSVRKGRHTNACFCVADEPTPCRPETAEVRPGESLVDELLRRGGLLRSGASVLAEIAEHRADDKHPRSPQ